MSVLTIREIRTLLDSGGLAFTPALDAFQMQPHGVDLRLGRTFYLPKTWTMTRRGREIIEVDYTRELPRDSWEKIELEPGQAFQIAPGELVLGTTLESIAMHKLNLKSVLYPRSSMNRRGLAINLTGIIDVGYAGGLIMPMINQTSQIITLYPGERVCHMEFYELASELTPEEAMQHGVVQAKYHATDAGSALAKLDAEEELRLIRSGSLDDLKEMYPTK